MACSSRKRKPTSSEPVPLEEMRLPSSTMYYVSVARETESIPDGPLEAVLDSSYLMQTPGYRIWQLRSTLQGLHFLRSTEDADVEMMIKEAEGRGLDGVLRGSRNAILLQPESLDLIDDDKQPGLSQELITDMFTKMSLQG
eukprot:gnl/MRDRNA2_/MRDRNA2_101210_c0_seq1.p1 gnl/MRDRNA2_/MRDRNA2_101210_c0~~gnl/MRDRNA2_/MRDRNA2_101210_c0_seq1.p1  ORF type:complete len:164 (+),score=32.65 gnl/MRDRNA2_/MRDRNA2_101210_c0_seq1:72-494(+)